MTYGNAHSLKGNTIKAKLPLHLKLVVPEKETSVQRIRDFYRMKINVNKRVT